MPDQRPPSPGSPFRGGPTSDGAPSRPPTPEELAAFAKRQCTAAAAAAVINILAVFLLPPAGAIAGWVGLRSARRQRATWLAAGAKPTTAAWCITGNALAAMLGTVVTIFMAIIWTDWNTYRDCTAGANTGVAQVHCDAAFQQAVQRRFGLLG